MAHPRKLSPMQAAEVYSMRARRVMVKDIAAHFGVSTNTIGRIMREAGSEKEPWQPKPCGTNAAYERHRRKGEIADDACLKAHAEHRQELSQADPHFKEKKKRWNDARYARAKSQSKLTGVPVSVLVGASKPKSSRR